MFNSMFNLSKVTVACILMLVVAGQFTLPLASHQAHEVVGRHLSHNSAARETYRLTPMRTIFTLKILVNGFEY